MNVSSTFGKLTKKQYVLTKKQRFMVLGMIGIVAILISVYTTTSDVEVAVVPNPPQGAVKTLSKSQIQDVQAVQVAPVTRDPFAAPPELKAQSNMTANANVPQIPNFTQGMVPKGVGQDGSLGNLKLTGIVGADGRNLAVITSGNKSKSYGVNEFVGPYKVMAITNDYVILASAESKLVLRIETSVQKGGQ